MTSVEHTGRDVVGMPLVGRGYRRRFRDPQRLGRLRWVRKISDNGAVVWTVSGPPGSEGWKGGRERCQLDYFVGHYDVVEGV